MPSSSIVSQVSRSDEIQTRGTDVTPLSSMMASAPTATATEPSVAIAVGQSPNTGCSPSPTTPN